MLMGIQRGSNHVSTLQDGRIMDSVMIVKDKHGPEAWL